MKNNLSTLSILHFVYGGFACVGGAVTLFILLTLGHLFQSDLFTGEAPPAFLGVLFTTIGWAVFGVLAVKGVANIISGSLLARAQGRVFSQVVAAMDCFNIPFGITLGIFTFLELNKPEVKQLYEDRAVGL